MSGAAGPATTAPPAALDEAGLAAALDRLASRDPDLARWRVRYGEPPLWALPASFATLARIVLEQQVSLASAAALWARLEGRGAGTPEGALALGEAGLAAAGVTRAKTRCLLGLAREVADGRLEPGGLGASDDDAVRERLTALRGIGPWTAEIFLLRALLRRDAFPSGDLALQKAAAALRGLPDRPHAARLRELAEAWRPERAAAVRLLWHGYLADPEVRRAPTSRAGR